MTVIMPGKWADQGQCAKYPREFIGWHWQKQQKICQGCPVIDHCREWALDTYDIGVIAHVTVHGGMIGRELAELKRQREAPDKLVCGNGHLRSEGKYCRTCKTDAEKQRRLEAKEAA